MAKRTIVHSPRLKELKKRRQKDFMTRILLASVGFFACFFLLAYISNFSSLNISQVQISGNKVIDTASIQKIVEGQIAGKYLWLFPRKNILIYPESRITQDLGTQFKRLDQINLSIKNKILYVNLSERMPAYTWCGVDAPVGSASDQCYFVDKSGFIFDEAPKFSGGVYFKLYGVGEVGSYFDKDHFDKLISFKKSLETVGVKPEMLYVPGDGNDKILLSNINLSGAHPEIIFKADADLNKVAENLGTALAAEPLKTSFRNKFTTLQYIDLRFGNKVYYKVQ